MDTTGPERQDLGDVPDWGAMGLPSRGPPGLLRAALFRLSVGWTARGVSLVPFGSDFNLDLPTEPVRAPLAFQKSLPGRVASAMAGPPVPAL